METHVALKFYTKQPLQGHARFESVVRTDSFNHTRLSWRIYQSYHPGELQPTEIYEYSRWRAGSRRRRGSWDAPTGWLKEEAQRSAAVIVSKSSNSSGSGARALREYACDAMQKRGSMHVTVKLQMKGAREDNLLVNVGRARESNC
eukprot:1475188-Pleurochrysis_carterae.AAC.1